MAKKFDQYNLETNNEYIFDEKANTVLTLREESWNGSPYKLFLRKCIADKEGNLNANKGFSFLTENGPHELAEELVRRGYGDTSELVNILKERDDINQEDLQDINVIEEEYYDPKDIFAIGVGGIND